MAVNDAASNVSRVPATTISTVIIETYSMPATSEGAVAAPAGRLAAEEMAAAVKETAALRQRRRWRRRARGWQRW